MDDINIIVMDIGGTFFRYNILNNHKILLEDFNKNKSDSPNFKNNSDCSSEKLTNLMIEKIIDSIENIKTRNPGIEINDIGISFAGPVDSEGMVRSSPTLWGNIVKDYPLKKKLENQLPHKVHILNDVSAACWYYKNKVKEERFCLITVSSGIGNKVFDSRHKDKIVALGNGFGGEIGHAFVNNNEYPLLCDCGSQGHLGAISSGRGTEKFARLYAKMFMKGFKKSILSSFTQGDPEIINNIKLIKAFKENDKFALDIIKRSSWYLSLMIQQIYMTIGVGKFIIIGGFALSLGENYRKIIIENLEEIGIWGLNKNEIKKLVELGIDDDSVNLHGIGEYIFSTWNNPE